MLNSYSLATMGGVSKQRHLIFSTCEMPNATQAEYHHALGAVTRLLRDKSGTFYDGTQARKLFSLQRNFGPLESETIVISDRVGGHQNC